MKPGLDNVAVVIPCLDEEAAIGPVVSGILAQGILNVIVVDNGSTDRTASVARAAGAQVVSEPRRGYGRACAAGVAAVTDPKTIICFMDGDGSDVPEFIAAALVSPIAEGRARISPWARGCGAVVSREA
jgi:glycosyltransferase involved in cell wall biosynthesis